MHDLALVMPVYNEVACIEAVLRSWVKVLDQLDIDYRIFAYDDGSKDGTQEVLQKLAGGIGALLPQRHTNRGHGPTILRGYYHVTRVADWVMQVDSDDEMSPEHFPLLWQERSTNDVLFGCRQAREQSWDRKIITNVAKLIVGFTLGRGLRDVNTPYRLMRASRLAELLRIIPPNTFAPNVLISGLTVQRNYRYAQIDVPHVNRRTGTVSLTNRKLWVCALRSAWQTLRTTWFPRRFSKTELDLAYANLPVKAHQGKAA